jgi:dihydrofolate reductase
MLENVEKGEGVTISLIVGMTKDRVIGKDNDLPWPRIKEDMKHFRKTTTDHIIVMGRKTYQSIGKPLPKRINMVVTRQKDLKFEGCWVFNSLDATIAKAIHFAQRGNINSEIFIIGGSAIYQAALPIADRIYLTEVKDDYPGDTYFPEFDRSEWDESELGETDKVKFVLLKRHKFA